MSITGTGFILILVGLYALIFKRNFLYYSAVFFVPFSAMAVLNIGSNTEGSAIQPYMFFGTLYIFSSVIKYFQTNIIKPQIIFKSEFKPLNQLFLFTLVALFSLIMPAIINGRITGNASGILGDRIPLIFTNRNISQFAYLLFGVLFCFFSFLNNRKEEQLKKTLRVYGYSIIFVIFWGAFQFLCYKTGISYPSFLFNNSASTTVVHDFVIDTNQITNTLRISSVGAEPSILSQSLVIYIPFLVLGLVYKKYVFSKSKDMTLLTAVVLFILFTTSSVGILTLFVIFLLLLVVLRRFIQKQFLKSFKVFILAFVVILILAFFFKGMLNNYLFSKSDSFSALERLDTIFSAWEVFLKYPILGVGWGTVTSTNMLTRILSSTGITGIFPFLLIFILILKQQLNSKKKLLLESKKPLYPEALLIAIIAMFFAANVAGFSYVFGYYWLIFSLAIVDTYKISTNKQYEDSIYVR